MSLLIHVEKVTHVLLQNGWHTVKDKSFKIEPHLFSSKGYVVLGDGDNREFGFSFKENGPGIVAGPMTAIGALRFDE